MNHSRLLSTALAATLIGTSISVSQVSAQSPRPVTRAERTNYLETSHYSDVINFMDSLVAMRAPIWVSHFGHSSEGRRLPIVIASKPVVKNVAEAKALGRPIVYVQANIHAGEVEGKEAMMGLLRDLSFEQKPNVLDSVVLLLIPIYNADGNEKFGDQARNRGSQNGPALVGLRPNGMGLDLNRDFIKAEAPETRSSLMAFNEWQPDIYMDLHTTNGSYHGYQLTYSQSLHPSAPLANYTIDTMLVDIKNRMKSRHNFLVYPYGNFTGEMGRTSLTETQKKGWNTYEHKPRFGTNYYGLRGAISILSEAYSHDEFKVRVAATRAFVHEILSYAAENSAGIKARVAEGRKASVFGPSGSSPKIAVKSKFASNPKMDDILVEVMEKLSDSTVRHEPGVPIGFKRTGRVVSVRMPVVDRFEAALERTPPSAGWVIDASVADSVLPRLRFHGVEVNLVQAPFTADVEVFKIDNVTKAERLFQGHNEVSLSGTWRKESRTIPAGSWVIPTGSFLDRVAMILLEPESDDGLVTWNMMDAGLKNGADAPVLRLMSPAR